jgi:hypothetical protein
LSVAIADVFGTALAGNSKERPELVDAPIIGLLGEKFSIAILLFICTQIFPKYKNAQSTQTTSHES